MSEPTTAVLPLPLAPSTSAAMHPAAALAAWLDGLVRGRRAALLGDATIGLAESLLTRGARLVHAYDPDAGRVAEAVARGGRGTQRPVFAYLDGDLGVRDGAFDVVVVPDLGIFPDPAEILRRARRLLSPSGVAVVASRNPEATRWLVRAGAVTSAGPTYYDLYDLLALQFPEVRMLGQTPFVGYAIVDFSSDEPDVTVDASLLDQPEAPEWYVAVAAERRVDVEDYSVVELPLEGVLAGLSSGEPTTLRRHEIEGNRQLLEARVHELELALARAAEVSDQGAAAARDREAIAARLAEAERELGAAVARMRESEARAADTHVRSERLSTELREVEDELRRQRERASRLGKVLDEERKARARVPVTIAAPISESAAVTERPGSRDERRTVEFTAAEAGLRAELAKASARIAQLEREKREDLPPPTIEPVTVEPATLDRERVRLRLIEVEAQLKTLEGRVRERDARAADAERRLVTALAQREALESRIAAAEPELASLRADHERLEAQRASAEAAHGEARAAFQRTEARLAQVEARLTQAESTRKSAEAARTAAEAGRTAAELLVAKAESARVEAEARAERAERAAREGASSAASVRAHGEEIDKLESALRERGREVTRLRAELREGLRVGKELLFELQAARVPSPLGGPGEGGPGGGSIGGGLPRGAAAEPRVEALIAAPMAAGSAAPMAAGSAAPIAAAASSTEAHGSAPAVDVATEESREQAARAEADRLASAMRIAQLENEVRRLHVPRAPDAVRRELERALALAHEELARVRVEREELEARSVPLGAASEQHVLLAQLDALRSEGVPSGIEARSGG